MNKHLALDIGNVLCTVDFSYFCQLVGSIVNISDTEVSYFLSQIQKQHDLGLISLVDEVKNKFKINSTLNLQRIAIAWENCVKADARSMAFIHNLMEKHNIKIALLSNIGPEHAVVMPRILTRQVYDKCVKHFSCDVGARKPSMIYYQSFLIANPQFEGCIYVDDLKPNLESAAKFDFKTFQFDLDKPNVNENFSKLEEMILTT